MKNIPIAVWLILLTITIIFANSCRKDESITGPETGTVSDIDGNTYKTVKIGNNWWMAENLKVTRYRTGDSLIFVSPPTADSVWSKADSGAYCLFEEKFGYLYNFFALSDSRGIAPQGWHIPSDEEWKQLETDLGMTREEADKLNWRGSDEGNKLKIVGGNTSYWAKSSDIYTVYGTNESGFTGLGASCRMFDGKWGELTHTAFWWTSSRVGDEAIYRGLDYDKTNVFRFSGYLEYGFSIRCIKD